MGVWSVWAQSLGAAWPSVLHITGPSRGAWRGVRGMEWVQKRHTHIWGITGHGAFVSLPAQLPQEDSSSCTGLELIQGICLQWPSPGPSAHLWGVKTQTPMPFTKPVPSASFPPSFTLGSLLDSARTISKKAGPAEVPLPASQSRCLSQPWGLYPHRGTVGGHDPTGDTQLRVPSWLQASPVSTVIQNSWRQSVCKCQTQF